MFEMAADVLILSMLILTTLRGPRPTTRPAYWSVFPFIVGAFCSLALASIINLVNVTQAARGSGLALYAGDTLNVILGLFGFLVPMVLAMSARSLPMYAGLEGGPRDRSLTLLNIFKRNCQLLSYELMSGEKITGQSQSQMQAKQSQLPS